MTKKKSIGMLCVCAMEETFLLISEEMQIRRNTAQTERIFHFLIVSDPLIILTVTNRGHKDCVVPLGIVTVNYEPTCII